MQIFAYCYKDSVRSEKYITSVEINQKNIYQLKTEGSKYIFTLNGIKDTMESACSANIDNARYFLYPYFGGVETAPRDITIRIKDL